MSLVSRKKNAARPHSATRNISGPAIIPNTKPAFSPGSLDHPDTNLIDLNEVPDEPEQPPADETTSFEDEDMDIDEDEKEEEDEDDDDDAIIDL